MMSRALFCGILPTYLCLVNCYDDSHFNVLQIDATCLINNRFCVNVRPCCGGFQGAHPRSPTPTPNFGKILGKFWDNFEDDFEDDFKDNFGLILRQFWGQLWNDFGDNFQPILWKLIMKTILG
jgi:hypothetical protein